MSPNAQETIAILVPVYNEAAGLAAFHQLLRQAIDALPYLFRVVYINDGSTDETPAILAQLAQQDGRVAVIELSRNFGHQAALSAGLDQAQGEAVICMDGDGQHPPHLLPQMIALYQQGYELVMAQRMDDQQPAPFKKWTSALFYWLINLLSDTHIQPGVADFRLMSRQVVEAIQKMPEYHRFLRGMTAWVGFRSVIVPYIPPQRLAGKSKYSLRKMLDLALDAIFSFSLTPLRIAIGAGLVFFFLAFVEVVYVLSFWVRGLESTLARGWSSLMFVILFVGGMIMLSLGFFGIYLGYIFQEVKRRPVYIIRNAAKPAPVDIFKGKETLMDEPMTKHKLLTELRLARLEWDALMAEVGEERMLIPGAAGVWTVKDVIAHLTSYNRWFVNASEAYFRGEMPPRDGTEGMDAETLNQHFYQQNKDKPLAQVLAESRQVYQRLLELVEAHTEEFLIQPQHFEGVPGTFVVWEILDGDNYGHSREHAYTIRQWLDKN